MKNKKGQHQGIYKVEKPDRSQTDRVVDNTPFPLLEINRVLAVAASKGTYYLNPLEGNQPQEGCPRIPTWLELRSYQQQAVESWFANSGRGMLKMATGSGKTITALAIASQLYQQIGLQVLLIICPFRHLVTQWARECEKFGMEPILAFESVHRWQVQLSTQLYNVRAGNQAFLSVITTNDTLLSEGLQSQLKYFPDKTLIIGDEAHNLGAKCSGESLPLNIGLRLGLSATPERHFDLEGTQAIFDYFGSVLQPEFTLADAIKQGALVRYFYYPILVEMTESESRAYLKLTRKIGRTLLYQKRDIQADLFEEGNEDLKSLLLQRARIIGSAANKLKALRQLMVKRLHTTHTLFYCGDGMVENQHQLAAVTRILGAELGYRVSTYTAQTPLDERENLRRQFESGELQGLVAIRCLDEGVDIPAIQTAVILASSRNPRQFIQRRGRILRPHPGKERATLFDTIVMPPELDREALEIERNLLRKELQRLVEFADLAENAGEARVKLLHLQKRFGLLDI